jgi:hypothetical protein
MLITLCRYWKNKLKNKIMNTHEKVTSDGVVVRKMFITDDIDEFNCLGNLFLNAVQNPKFIYGFFKLEITTSK